MQFIGKKGIALFVAIVVIACGVGFGSGLLVGRQLPAHRFERFGETRFLLDPTTGKVCDPFKDPNAAPVDLTDLFGPNAPQQGKSAPDPFAAYGGHEVKPAPNYPPPCGKRFSASRDMECPQTLESHSDLGAS